jgi:hypothetical protein
MNALFGFSLRFLVSFLAAKLLLRSLDLERLGWLLGLSLLFTANLYWFDFTKYSNKLTSNWWQKPSQEDKKAPPRLLPPTGTNGP